MRPVFLAISVLSMLVSGCSMARNQPVIYAAGDKATVGPLVYNVTDTEVAQQLGDDPTTSRTPQNRFYLVHVAISNSSTDDQPIPTMTLVDDSGKSYTELEDGTNVPNWLGVVRKVGPAQTDQGVVVFDAPTMHYRLRVSDPADEKEIAIDVPLNFIHEQSRDLDPATRPAAISNSPK